MYIVSIGRRTEMTIYPLSHLTRIDDFNRS